MKKLTILFIALCFTAVAYGQTLTIEPAKFTAIDEITITVDVSGNAQLEGLSTDAYLWCWIPGVKDATSNVNPASSNPDASGQARFERVSDNVFQLTMIPTSFLAADPGQIQQIGMILKGDDWSNGQTTDFVLDVDPLTFIPRINRTFPADFTNEDVVLLYFDQSFAPAGLLQDASTVMVRVSVNGVDGSGGAVSNVGGELMLQMTDTGSGIFRAAVIPNSSFTVPNDVTLTEISYTFVDATGQATSDTYTKSFTSTQ